MVFALVISLALTQAAPAVAPAPGGGDNLWLVQGLYPGQEVLVGRTEQAIHTFLPAGSTDLVGRAALATLLKEHHGDVACALSEVTCTSPLEAYLRGLGLRKLVLVRAGQEEPSFRVDVVSIDLATGEQRSATGTNGVFERALVSALVKVAPLASLLKVTTTPPGAELFIDGEKLGKTPYQGQVLPGERTLKLVIPRYAERTLTVNIPSRGNLVVNETLELLPSNLSIKPVQKLATISLDGKELGKGDFTLPVAAGLHTVTAQLEGYDPYSHAVTVPASGEATDVPDLHPSIEATILGRQMYLQLGFVSETLRKHKGSYRVNAMAFNLVKDQSNPHLGALGLADAPAFRGVNLDWGQQRGHFGLLLVGLSFLPAASPDGLAFPDSATGSFNEPSKHSVPGKPSYILDLHFLQPQANFVAWRFMGYLQAGIGLRGLFISTPKFLDIDVVHSDGYVDVAPYASIKGGVRFYLVDGLYLNASYRFSYVMALNARDPAVTSLSNTDGFEAGIGYAY
jgi:hypothetical protein